MKLYDSKFAPNPRRVRIFLAEKGIAVPAEQIDIAKLEHKTPEYAAINPLQRMPSLVLDDGAIITESIFRNVASSTAAIWCRCQRCCDRGNVESKGGDQFSR